MNRKTFQGIVDFLRRVQPHRRRGIRDGEIERTRVVLRAFCVVALLLTAGFFAYISASQHLQPVDAQRLPASIEVTSPTETRTFLTYLPTLIPALDEAGITIGDEDRLNLPADFALKAGSSYRVQIDDLHTVRLSWNGIAISATSASGSVQALASSAGYSDMPVTGNDRVETSGTDGTIGPGTEVSYVTVRSDFITSQEPMPFDTVYVDDPAYRIGNTVVVQNGVDGIRQITYEEVFEDGLLSSRNQVKTEVLKNPVPKIIRRGSSAATTLDFHVFGATVWSHYQIIQPMLIRNGSLNYLKFKDNGNGTITVDGRTFTVLSSSMRHVTAYDAIECSSDHLTEHNTFSGLPARRGLVAVYGFYENGKWVATRLPMGTVLFIENYGLAVVGDIHHVTDDIDRIDLAYDPREVLDNYRLGLTNRHVFILALP